VLCCELLCSVLIFFGSASASDFAIHRSLRDVDASNQHVTVHWGW